MLQKPYEGDYRFTLEFGESYGGILNLGSTKHLGLDVALPISTPIHAPGDGRVVAINQCGTCGDYGKYIKLEIGKLWVYLSHLSEVLVEVGQNVKAGDLIGRSGNTGRVTGPHLDIRVHDLTKWNEPMKDYQNPREYIQFEGVANSQPVRNEPTPEPMRDVSVRTYTVQPGDTLWFIAKKFYGRGSQWPKIFDANRDLISDENLIFPEQVLRIPE